LSNGNLWKSLPLKNFLLAKDSFAKLELRGCRSIAHIALGRIFPRRDLCRGSITSSSAVGDACSSVGSQFVESIKNGNE
jgi:hypothetical protein